MLHLILATVSERDVIRIVIILAIAAVLWWFITWLNLPEPVVRIGQIVIAVVLVIIAIKFLYSL